MKLAIISDIHCKWNKVQIPECDVLISCGDYSFQGEKHVVEDFHKWLNKQEAGYIISVQGNHETWVEKNFAQAKEIAEKACPGVHFIDEGAVEIEGVKFYGSAITPFFCNWAWNRARSEAEQVQYQPRTGRMSIIPLIKPHWDKIPDDTQILITHGPPHGILDKVYEYDGVTVREQVGCKLLMDRIHALKQIKMHCFGHIHGSSGEQSFMGVKYINASICDEQYQPTNPVRIFEF